MKFSYIVQGKYLLKNVYVPVEKSSLIVITGEEGNHFNSIGGIIAGLFPIVEDEIFSPLEELIKFFTGKLEVIEGEVPHISTYIGPDPEKHLLFSRVDEEIFAQTGIVKDHVFILEKFGLGENFLKRKISTLSGGEKMKLALSIAFSSKKECIVLHGILPWLDREGKICLMKQINKKLKEEKSIILLEQDIDWFSGIAKAIFYFNGESTIPYTPQLLQDKQKNVSRISDNILRKINKRKESEELVRFESVFFRYQESVDEKWLFNRISFNLSTSRIYSLIGENGSGKSTLAKLILRLEKPDKGEIFLSGIPLSQIKRDELVKEICFVGQFPEQQITLSDVEQYKKRAKKKNNLLSLGLLENYFDSKRSFPIAELTPVQLKAVALISSLYRNTKLIILDEPTWGIDLSGESFLLEILDRIIDELNCVSILIITHNMEFIRRLSTEVLWLNRGILKQYTDFEEIKKDGEFQKFFGVINKNKSIY